MRALGFPAMHGATALQESKTLVASDDGKAWSRWDVTQRLQVVRQRCNLPMHIKRAVGYGTRLTDHPKWRQHVLRNQHAEALKHHCSVSHQLPQHYCAQWGHKR